MGVGSWWCRGLLASQGCQQCLELIISPPLLVLAPLFFLLASLFLLQTAFPFLLASVFLLLAALFILKNALLLEVSEKASEVGSFSHVCCLLGLLPGDRPWHTSCTYTNQEGVNPSASLISVKAGMQGDNMREGAAVWWWRRQIEPRAGGL